MNATELQAELRKVQDRLDALPVAHRVDVPAAVQARRAALTAYRESLENQLSTAIVEERRRVVEKARIAGDKSLTTTSTTRATDSRTPQASAE